MLRPNDFIRPTASRKVLISGLLLRVGISGAALAVWAVASGVSAQTSVPVAVIATFSGAAITALALHKAWRMLADDEAEAKAAPAPRRAHRAAFPSFARLFHSPR